MKMLALRFFVVIFALVSDVFSELDDDGYIELDRTVQGFVVSQELLNSRGCARRCESIEESYLANACKIADTPECQFFLKDKCDGAVMYCQDIGDHFEYCPSASGKRRYQWVKALLYRRNYGNITDCPDVQSVKHSPPTNLYPNPSIPCSFCMCTCISSELNDHTLRAISFMEQESNIKENKVITNVMFEAQGNIIHVKAQEGKLIEGGLILPHSQSWIVHDNFTMTNGQVYATVNVYQHQLLQGMHYSALRTYPGHRQINLDNINVPQGHVVTGVKMGTEDIYDPERQQFVGLQLKATKFDVTTGQLEPKTSIWISAKTLDPIPEVYNRKRKEIELNAPTNPRKFDNVQISEGNQYVVFRASDYHKDAGQTTVPIFDATASAINSLKPLTGINLILRGADGSGGVLAFQLVPLTV